MRKSMLVLALLAVFAMLISACAPAAAPTEEPEVTPEETEAAEPTADETEVMEPTETEEVEATETEAATSEVRVAVVLDTGGENDRSFNEYTLKGAREAAEELGADFAYVVSESPADYGRNIENFISEGYNMIITVGFLMGDSTAEAAIANPDVSFAIIDYAYFPNADTGTCAPGSDVVVEDGGSCYDEALANVTSLMFAEDEVGYLAGVLAGCMTESNVIGSVSGMEIPPVQKFVTGYQTGAKAQNPDVETLNVYIPDFNDPATGKQAGQEQIAQGADVIFGVGGNTGNGGLLAAHEEGLLAIGVDVDQYFTYPEVAASLLTSAAKNMDVAAGDAVRAFADGSLEAGISLATIANEGVGLAPYHDQEANIPQECMDAVDAAREGLADGSIDTGWGE
jgi:basic membrane protein A and related proteins